MRCDLHCPPAGSALRAPLLAAAVLAAVALGVYVLSALGGFLVAALVLVMLTNAIAIALFVRLVRPGQAVKIYRPEVAALPAPPRAIEAARTVPVVVLGAAEGERLAR